MTNLWTTAWGDWQNTRLHPFPPLPTTLLSNSIHLPAVREAQGSAGERPTPRYAEWVQTVRGLRK